MKKSEPWNKDRSVGQKPPLSIDQVQIIKMLLSQAGNLRDVALFSLAIDSSLRGCDLIRLRVQDLASERNVYERASITQKKTTEKVSFSMSPYTREAIRELIETENKSPTDFLFTRQKGDQRLSITPTHYRRLVKTWITHAQLDPAIYCSHSLRRTKVALVYKETGNLRAAQVLLGHKSIENTKNYLGIEQDEALSIGERFHDIL